MDSTNHESEGSPEPAVSDAGSVCKDGCGTVLSRLNLKTGRCFSCQQKKEVRSIEAAGGSIVAKTEKKKKQRKPPRLPLAA